MRGRNNGVHLGAIEKMVNRKLSIQPFSISGAILGIDGNGIIVAVAPYTKRMENGWVVVFFVNGSNEAEVVFVTFVTISCYQFVTHISIFFNKLNSFLIFI